MFLSLASDNIEQIATYLKNPTPLASTCKFGNDSLDWTRLFTTYCRKLSYKSENQVLISPAKYLQLIEKSKNYSNKNVVKIAFCYAMFFDRITRQADAEPFILSLAQQTDTINLMDHLDEYTYPRKTLIINSQTCQLHFNYEKLLQMNKEKKELRDHKRRRENERKAIETQQVLCFFLFCFTIPCILPILEIKKHCCS